MSKYFYFDSFRKNLPPGVNSRDIEGGKQFCKECNLLKELNFDGYCPECQEEKDNEQEKTE